MAKDSSDSVPKLHKLRLAMAHWSLWPRGDVLFASSLGNGTGCGVGNNKSMLANDLRFLMTRLDSMKPNYN